MPAQARVVDSRVVYDGRIFEVVVEEVELPGHNRSLRVELVRHAGSVGIAAMPTAR